ncbi:MAG: hypothetical protein WD793_14840 [Steroidobacteraceae bacterium]
MKSGVILVGVAATLAAAFLLLHNDQEGGRDELPSFASPLASSIAPSTTTPGVRQLPLPVTGIAPQGEILPLTDATGLLHQSLTIDELLDQVEADSGGAFSALEREQLAAELRADPELRKAFVN